MKLRTVCCSVDFVRDREQLFQLGHLGLLERGDRRRDDRSTIHVGRLGRQRRHGRADRHSATSNAVVFIVP